MILLFFSELFGILSTLLYMISITMVLYTVDSVYRVSYFISACLMLVALPTVIILCVYKMSGNTRCTREAGKVRGKVKTN